jgi:hypothetical protein
MTSTTRLLGLTLTERDEILRALEDARQPGSPRFVASFSATASAGFAKVSCNALTYAAVGARPDCA